MGWTIGVLGFDSRQGLGIFLFTTASRTALGPTQPPIQWVPGGLSLGVKRPGREADHSPPSSAEVKNAWSYTFTPPIRLHGVVRLCTCKGPRSQFTTGVTPSTYFLKVAAPTLCLFFNLVKAYVTTWCFGTFEISTYGS
jgi:hypothetical protein